MQDHHNPPTHKRNTLGGRCPKCGSRTIPDISWQHGKLEDAWRCFSCGLTSESGGYVDVVKKRTVPMEGHAR